MHPAIFAKSDPDRAAFIMAGSGETVTYRQLEERSNQGAHLFRSLGLKAGDGVALFMDNHPRFLEIAWAAQRCGLYYTCISAKLSAGEVEYIVGDCGAQMLIVSPGASATIDELPGVLSGVKLYIVGEDRTPYSRYEVARDTFAPTPIADETAGTDIIYSSGTTGRPKGIKPPLTGGPIEQPAALAAPLLGLFAFPQRPIYLSPAPLYHAAPLRTSMAIQRTGGTLVVMERFDPEEALRLIEAYGVQCGQFVPTHFVRMLKLPQDVRAKYDLSTLVSAVHSAGPCPIPVKEQMIAWWGPIIYEYYSGTEGIGRTLIDSQDS